MNELQISAEGIWATDNSDSEKPRPRQVLGLFPSTDQQCRSESSLKGQAHASWLKYATLGQILAAPAHRPYICLTEVSTSGLHSGLPL